MAGTLFRFGLGCRGFRISWFTVGIKALLFLHKNANNRTEVTGHSRNTTPTPEETPGTGAKNLNFFTRERVSKLKSRRSIP
jgi:hypothetical protein